MIPLIDDYLKDVITKNLTFLKEHPEVIDKLFSPLAKRETVDKIKQFIINHKLKVIIGFPREPQSLPCYVITLAGEQEQPLGIGEDMGTYDIDFNTEEDNENSLPYVPLSAVGMNASYRVECWSDNGDLTSYMYSILKFCLLSERFEMYKKDLLNISLSATDLEPVPDYFPVFVYRRALMVSLMYTNVFFSTTDVNAIDVSDGQDIIEYIPQYYIQKD